MPAKSFDQEVVDAEIFADLHGSGVDSAEDGRPEQKPRFNAPASGRRKWSACWRGREYQERLKLRKKARQIKALSSWRTPVMAGV
ncbi:MAG: hypothetical protein LBU32_30725 [Clostridiales bacterium]|jgi:hypothetical protein|nr:hypothetical protein [Clostridiales bacterium]